LQQPAENTCEQDTQITKIQWREITVIRAHITFESRQQYCLMQFIIYSSGAIPIPINILGLKSSTSVCDSFPYPNAVVQRPNCKQSCQKYHARSPRDRNYHLYNQAEVTRWINSGRRRATKQIQNEQRFPEIASPQTRSCSHLPPDKASSLATETIEGAALALESIDNVERCDGLALRVLSVGNGITDDTLEEGLENATGLLVNHCKAS